MSRKGLKGLLKFHIQRENLNVLALRGWPDLVKGEMPSDMDVVSFEIDILPKQGPWFAWAKHKASKEEDECTVHLIRYVFNDRILSIQGNCFDVGLGNIDFWKLRHNSDIPPIHRLNFTIEGLKYLRGPKYRSNDKH